MDVVATTMCYPHAGAPTQGIFVERRLRAIHAIRPVEVVAPVPWFPVVRPYPTDISEKAHAGTQRRRDEMRVWRPRMFYVPGVFKGLDAGFYARALGHGLRARGGAAPALIDAHFEWPDGVGAWRVARRIGAKFVCTLRGKLVSQIADAGKRRAIREMLCGADGLIAVSKSLARLANEVAGRELGVRVIPNGIDRGVFRRMFEVEEARRRLGWALAARYIVSVGHLQELKGFHRLAALWNGVRRLVGDARLVLVGGEVGERGFARRLREQIRANGLEEVVTIAGRHSAEQVALMLNAADLFVLATRSEGWNNAMAEAQACGCPVVTTDVGGNSEIIREAWQGRLVEAEAGTELERAIVEGLEGSWDRTRIAEAGSVRDWSQVARECVDVWEEVLGKREQGTD